MYIEVQFEYRWIDKETPYCGNPGDDLHSREASMALEFASKSIHDSASRLKIPCRHCYAWPDGTLVKWFLVNDRNDLERLFIDLSKQEKMRIIGGYEIEREEDYETHQGRTMSQTFK